MILEGTLPLTTHFEDDLRAPLSKHDPTENSISPEPRPTFSFPVLPAQSCDSPTPWAVYDTCADAALLLPVTRSSTFVLAHPHRAGHDPGLRSNLRVAPRCM